MEATELVKPGTPAFQQKLSSLPLDIKRFNFSVPAGKSMGYGYGRAVGDNTPVLVESLTHVKVHYSFNDESKLWVINTLYPSAG